MKWSIEDFQADLCDLGDVGKTRPAPEPPADAGEVEVVPIDQPLSALLATHTHQAYIELGGKEYLKANPHLLHKMLLKQVEPAYSQQVLEANTARLQGIRDEMPWVSARRLMYQMESRLAEDIVPKDRAAIETDAPSEPAAEPPSTAAQHEFPEPSSRVASTAPRASTPLPSETADIRKEYGSRGNARHK